MQTTNNINSINFQGKFLSERTVTKAIKRSKKNIIEQYYDHGKAFDKTVLADIDKKGEKILKDLQSLAEKLPKDFDLVLEKTRYAASEEAFCLNMRHKGFKDTEVFGNIDSGCLGSEISCKCHSGNVRPPKHYGSGYSLERIETAIEGFELLNPKEMVSRYVSFICRRLNVDIRGGHAHNIKKKLEIIDSIMKNNWTSKTSNDERINIDRTIQRMAEEKKNRRGITLFKLKRAFCLEK